MKKGYKGFDLTAIVNNFSFSFDDIGEGNVPVIFLHGFPFDKTMWQSQLDALGSSHRVIAYDIRGFGRSKDEISPLSIDMFADDLIAFMNELSIDKAIICGLSMGGYIALNALKRSPERFDGLILCDTQCIADTPEVKKKRIKTVDEIKAKGVHDFNEKFIKSVFHKDSLTGKTEVVEELRKVVFANSPHIIAQGLLALAARSETCSGLSDIHIPTLIICGREDELTPLVRSEFMNKNIKGSALRVIDKAGHVSNLEQPNEFNKHLADFLDPLTGVKVKDLIGNKIK
jgi:3-oxoadipate enol-lactonase